MQRFAWIVVGVLVTAVISGCSGGEIAAPVDSPVAIEISQFALTVRNVAGLPLSNLTIGIKPGGVRPEYKKSLQRLGNGQNQDIPYAEFRGVDRNALDLQSVNPRYVHITATDLEGKEYDVQLPWE
jgi:hypothetical protein